MCDAVGGKEERHIIPRSKAAHVMIVLMFFLILVFGMMLYAGCRRFALLYLADVFLEIDRVRMCKMQSLWDERRDECRFMSQSYYSRETDLRRRASTTTDELGLLYVPCTRVIVEVRKNEFFHHHDHRGPVGLLHFNTTLRNFKFQTFSINLKL
jgi:hypothetical protein